ncbi:MAG: transposase [Clostridia bacterium]|nr:transposase [Clostridia bacterium]MBQ7044010.1 transposase [Clostridia bacterium]
MDLPKRKPTRLKKYDYSTPGAYFVTICTKNRKNLFGKIDCKAMTLNYLGLIVNQEINNIEKHYTNIKIDKYIIMPNHIHMIIIITEKPDQTAGMNPCPTIRYDIPNVVGKFKAAVTRNVGNAFMHSVKGNLWQISFNDHIIRGEKDYHKIWEYIDANVLKWESDCFYCD